MKNLCYRLLVRILVIFTVASSCLQAAEISSTAAGGNWSETTTWNGGVVPDYGDNVTIVSGATVTIDVKGSCNNLIVNGTLQFADVTTSLDLTIKGDLNVVTGGSLLAAGSTNHSGYGSLNIYGNLTLTGTFVPDKSPGRMLVIYMYGGEKYIDALGKDFFYLVINVPKGSSITLNSSFSISSRLTLIDGTLDNSTHNITIGSNTTMYRGHSTAVLTAPPIFLGGNHQCNYGSSMTTGNELPDTLSYLTIQVYVGGATLTLSKNVTVINNILFSGPNEKILTGSNTLTLLGNKIYQKDSTDYIIGNLARAFSSAGNLTFPIGTNDAYRPVTINATSITGSGTITVSQTDTTLSTTTLPNGINKISGVRYWTITPSSSITSLTADVTLNWGTDDGVTTPSNIKAVHGNHSSGSWDIASGTGSGTQSSGSVTGTGFTSFGDFTLGTIGADTLGWVTVPTIPEIISPNDNAIDQPAQLTLKINPSLNKPKGYHWQVSTNQIFNNPFVDDTTNATECQVNLSPDTKYYWRVSAINSGGESAFTATVQFTTAKAVNVNDANGVPKEFALYQNYPNPFNPSTVIRYQLPVAGKVTLKIYDVLGREVAIIVDNYQQAGSYNIQLSTDYYQLTSGVYLYKLTTGNYSTTRKMIVLK